MTDQAEKIRCYDQGSRTYLGTIEVIPNRCRLCGCAVDLFSDYLLASHDTVLDLCPECYEMAWDVVD